MTRWTVSLFILGVLLLPSGSRLSAQAFYQETAPEPSEPGVVARSDHDVLKLRAASAQYEIIQVLIEEGKYGEVVPEFEKILELDLRAEDQELIVQSAWNVIERLREARQFGVAHRVVQATLQRVTPAEHQVMLLILQGKIYQDQKLYQKALQSLRKARQLQEFLGRQEPD